MPNNKKHFIEIWCVRKMLLRIHVHDYSTFSKIKRHLYLLTEQEKIMYSGKEIKWAIIMYTIN